MKVFCNGSANQSSMVLHVQPGRDHPEKKEWVDSQGHPIMFSVRFVHGKSDDIDSQLAHYLIKKDLASSSPIIQPKDFMQ